MKRALLMGVLGLLSVCASASSVCDSASKELVAAVDVYKEEGNQAFMKRLLKNGPLETDARSISQSQSLGQIEQFFGSLEGFSILSTKQLGNKSCYIISVLEYEKGPAFAVTNYYSGVTGTGATSMFFRTEPEAILPQEFLIK